MKSWSQDKNQPLILALAGPNGSGKTTFFQAHLRSSGLRFVNADAIARELKIGPYEAATVAAALRAELVKQRESFIFETVLSDPVGEKIAFLKDTAASGYHVILCYIGLASAELSDERVSMRVSQGGHDVPLEKLLARYPRTLENLRRAIRDLQEVWIFDNSDLAYPYRKITKYLHGQPSPRKISTPAWLSDPS